MLRVRIDAIFSVTDSVVNRAVVDFSISQQKRRQRMLTPFGIGMEVKAD
jgi:hypothetical protein